MSFPCEICQRTPARDGVTVYRVNEYGIAGIWRCEAHLQTTVDADLRTLVDDLKDVLAEMKHEQRKEL
jgi:hypothetical protein